MSDNIDNDERWWDDEDFSDAMSDRFSCRNPVGMTLGQLVEWAESLRDEHGEDTILADISTDEEFPSVELGFNTLKDVA